MRGLYDSANIDEMSSSGNKIIKYVLGVKILREKFQPKCHYVGKKWENMTPIISAWHPGGRIEIS